MKIHLHWHCEWKRERERDDRACNRFQLKFNTRSHSLSYFCGVFIRVIPWFLAQANTLKLRQNRRQNVVTIQVWVCVTPLSCKIQSIASQLCIFVIFFSWWRWCVCVCVCARVQRITNHHVTQQIYLRNKIISSNSNHRKWFNAKIHWMNFRKHIRMNRAKLFTVWVSAIDMLFTVCIGFVWLTGIRK